MVKIANIMLPGNLVLSPMAGITDAPMRQIARQCGADYAICEMISSDASLWNNQKTQIRLKGGDTHLPRIIQIAGASADVIADAAKKCQNIGADILEINMGCPAKKVCNVLAGSALLKDELLVSNILNSVVKSVQIPVILKTRLGWNNANKNILTISKIAEAAGIASITIHGRTRQDLYNGCASYDLIAEVKQQSRIPVFANGDITTPEIAKYVLDYTKADGLYIGRGALGNPWLFQQIKDYLAHGSYCKQVDFTVIMELIQQHLTLIYTHYGEIIGTRMSRKHIKWYLQYMFANDKATYQEMLSKFSVSESKYEQMDLINDFFIKLKAI